MKEFYISSDFMRYITPVLKELIRERVTEVLPTLQTLFLEKPPPPGPVHETIGQFVAARRLVGHPLAISSWEEGYLEYWYVLSVSISSTFRHNFLTRCNSS